MADIPIYKDNEYSPPSIGGILKVDAKMMDLLTHLTKSGSKCIIEFQERVNGIQGKFVNLPLDSQITMVYSTPVKIENRNVEEVRNSVSDLEV
jgi:hypothetical protein